MIAKKNYLNTMRFLSGGRIKNQKRLNCADRRYLMLSEREELLFKVGANTVLQKKKYLAQEKLHRMAQHTKIQISLIKWWNGWYITLLVLRYQYEWPTFPTQNGNTTEKINGRYENKKLCCHKCIRNFVVINVPIAHFWLET